MKKYLFIISTVITLIILDVGCNNIPKEDSNSIKISKDNYKIGSNTSFFIAIDTKTYLKLLLLDGNIQEEIFTDQKVIDKKIFNPYNLFFCKDTNIIKFISYSEPFSNVMMWLFIITEF